ncbi:MAG: hypothetical protein JKY53_04870 [Flavobacteriales bacterium]|nr:hypothetical protein [Flavobacteriales bacterium]
MTKILKASLISILILLIAGFVYPLRNEYYKVSGSCKIENGDYSHQKIILKRDTLIIATLNEQKAFQFQLDYNTEYTVTFTKPNYITKTVLINTTNVSPARIEFGFEPYFFSITLEQQPDSQHVYYKGPVAVVGYSAEFEEFNYRTFYKKTFEDK